MDRSLTYLGVRPTDSRTAAEVLRALRPALDGSGPALAPWSAGSTGQNRPHGPARQTGHPTDPDPRVPDEVALVVRTSGSTGTAREVLLDRAALTASAEATHARLGGPGRWLLALPLTHVAGLQVLVRSILAGTDPLVVTAGAGPAALARAVDQHRADVPLYTSLVPTQLQRVLAGIEATGGLPADLAPLRRLEAILVGGAAAPGTLLDRARDQGLRVVTTYGMTETSGGCVYDGLPLDPITVDVSHGIVRLSGPVLARGYRDGQDDAFVLDAEGRRWFCTQDLGRIDQGMLSVTGRVDDIVVTGGEKVAPAVVEAVIAGLPGVAQVCVVGVPDPEWGQALTAVVVAEAGPGARTPPTLDQLRSVVSRTLWGAAAPRHLLLVDALPERGPGKVDRVEVARRAVRAVRPPPSA